MMPGIYGWNIILNFVSQKLSPIISGDVPVSTSGEYNWSNEVLYRKFSHIVGQNYGSFSFNLWELPVKLFIDPMVIIGTIDSEVKTGKKRKLRFYWC